MMAVVDERAVALRRSEDLEEAGEGVRQDRRSRVMGSFGGVLGVSMLTTTPGEGGGEDTTTTIIGGSMDATSERRRDETSLCSSSIEEIIDERIDVITGKSSESFCCSCFSASNREIVRIK